MKKINLLLAAVALLFLYVFYLRKQPVVRMSKAKIKSNTTCNKMLKLDINGNEIPCPLIKK